MSILTTDVIETILLGVSAFDLVRCKAVCKVWRSLISSADFVAEHFERSKSDPSSHHLLVHNRRRPEAAAAPFQSFACFSSSDLFIVGSVNGLICIAGKPFGTLSPDDIWILNPLTGLSKLLPYSSRNFNERSYRIKLAFWCDEDDGVYNVARIVTDNDGPTVLELWVSTSPDTWTVISTFESDSDFHLRQHHACDVLIQGLAAYWIDVRSRYEGDSDTDSGYDIECYDRVTVVSLDLKTLALAKFTPLNKGQLRMRKCSLWKAYEGEPNSVLFGGKLNGKFVLVTLSPALGRVYNIWALMDHTAEACWIKKNSIRFPSYPFEKCLGIVNDKLVLSCYDDKEVALCDPLTGKLEVVETGPKLVDITLGSACGFVGSLVSIDGSGFEWNHILCKNMGIKWPYSLYPPALIDDWRKNCKRQRRKLLWDSKYEYKNVNKLES